MRSESRAVVDRSSRNPLPLELWVALRLWEWEYLQQQRRLESVPWELGKTTKHFSGEPSDVEQAEVAKAVGALHRRRALVFWEAHRGEIESPGEGSTTHSHLIVGGT